MRGKEDSLPAGKAGGKDGIFPSNDETENMEVRSPGQNKDTLDVCRVCQCAETDKKGEAALEFLGIYPPSNNHSQAKTVVAESNTTGLSSNAGIKGKNEGSITNQVEYVSPDGEICICGSDLEAGPCLWHHDALIELGCSCKNELALAHYSCALRWFISRGLVICEICGNPPMNVRPADHSKIIAALKECETLRLRTAPGEATSAYTEPQAGVEPDAVAALRRQRLTEISSWFDPHSNATTGAQVTADQASNGSADDVFLNVNPTTKWAVEGTGILVATGLLTVTLAWLIAPRVGKKTARRGLHVLLGGLCALTVVVFLRFGVLPRIKYGPARYWAILLVFWFLVFGVWASSTRTSHTN
eukprot:Gb_30244 [translate_table: standard]